MITLKHSMTALSLAAAAGLCCGTAQAQISDRGEWCYVPGTGTVPIGANGITEEDCSGSINRVFSGSGLLSSEDETTAQNALIANAVLLCDLPDGPYVRTKGGATSPLDYVLAVAEKNDSPSQIAYEAPSSVVGVAGLDSFLTVSLDSVTDPITILTTASARSQLLDIARHDQGTETTADDAHGGAEFIFVRPTRGKGNPQVGFLICGYNMWFDESPDTAGSGANFGVKALTLGFDPLDFTAGFAVGPSGAGSQGGIGALCSVLTRNSGGEHPNPNLERDGFFINGVSKVQPGNAKNPINVTHCAPGFEGSYCSEREPQGTSDKPNPSSCNPRGERAGLPKASTSSVGGVNSISFYGFGNLDMYATD